MAANERPPFDRELTDIADYVMNFKVGRAAIENVLGVKIGHVIAPFYALRDRRSAVRDAVSHDGRVKRLFQAPHHLPANSAISTRRPEVTSEGVNMHPKMLPRNTDSGSGLPMAIRIY